MPYLRNRLKTEQMTETGSQERNIGNDNVEQSITYGPSAVSTGTLPRPALRARHELCPALIHGFTLIEILVTLAISSIILLIIYNSLKAVMETQKQVPPPCPHWTATMKSPSRRVL